MTPPEQPPAFHLLASVTPSPEGAPAPPSLVVKLTPDVLSLIVRAQAAAGALVRGGDEVYGIDVQCGTLSASPLTLDREALNADWVQADAGMCLLAGLPEEEEDADFWDQPGHRIDVRYLRVDDQSLRLFAWRDGGTVRMQSRPVLIDELLRALNELGVPVDELNDAGAEEAAEQDGPISLLN